MTEVRNHQHYGVNMPDLGWAPTPRYLLRRNRVLSHASRFANGKMLEIGCGSGALLEDFRRLGLECFGLDTSSHAISIARSLHKDHKNVHLFSQAEDWKEHFDLIVTLEVMEHIENDSEALRQWVSWLKPGGKMILSVPAHQKKWGPSDEFVGHFRRYEKDDLIDLFEKEGMKVDTLECYGFPLSNIMDPIRSAVHKRHHKIKKDEEMQTRTSHSGVRRNVEFRFFPLQASWFGVQTLKMFSWMQEKTLDRPWGDGYLAVAEKVAVKTS